MQHARTHARAHTRAQTGEPRRGARARPPCKAGADLALLANRLDSKSKVARAVPALRPVVGHHRPAAHQSTRLSDEPRAKSQEPRAKSKQGLTEQRRQRSTPCARFPTPHPCRACIRHASRHISATRHAHTPVAAPCRPHLPLRSSLSISLSPCVHVAVSVCQYVSPSVCQSVSLRLCGRHTSTRVWGRGWSVCQKKESTSRREGGGQRKVGGGRRETSGG